MGKYILNLFGIVWLVLAIIDKYHNEIDSYRMSLTISSVFVCGQIVVNQLRSK